MNSVSKDVNEFDHFTNLMNGMWIGKLSKAFKEEKKRNGKKDFFYEVIRNQYCFGKDIETSYLKNKQAFNVNIRKKINSFSPENGLKYIHSKALIKELGKQSSDVIVDCAGVIGTPNGLNDWFINVNYNFHFQSQLIEFINFDIEEMLKSTPVPYKEEFFKVGSKNADKFLSSIIAGYIKVFPEAFPDLFKIHSYDAILVMFPDVINMFSFKNHYIDDDEMMNLYINTFFSNYIQFDEKIKKYATQFVKPKDH
jgi:hypothetical protein